MWDLGLLRREGPENGRGLHGSVEGSDRWEDTGVTRYVNSLQVENSRLWPMVEHKRGSCYILVLPLVEPRHLAAYQEICGRSDCGGAASDQSFSSLLLDLPCVTG